MRLAKLPLLLYVFAGLAGGTLYALLSGEWFLGLAWGFCAGMGTGLTIRGIDQAGNYD